MKYSITGSLGLIGERLKKDLDNKGHECLRDVDIGFNQGLKCNITQLQYEVLNEKVDTMYHLASFCKINKCVEDPLHAYINNIHGTYSVFEFCRKNDIKNVVYFSSSRVLSKEKNPYTASKLYGEELCKAYKECYDINYKIIRPSTVYGPGIDNTHRLMDIWINNAKENKDLIIYGDKNKTLDFTYIDDFITALNKCETWNEEYNISGMQELKLCDVAKEIISQSGSKSNIVYKKAEISQPQRVKIKNTIQYKPKIDIKEGIRRCLK